jgi:acyl-CoA thioesterase-2
MRLQRQDGQANVDRLLRQVDLERLDRDLFLGSPGRGTGRLFGGLIAAQAVMAAGRTVEQLPMHSLHAYFLRPGNHEAPIRYTVYRIRDGRSFTSRDVFAYQSGEAIFSMSASFHAAERGADFETPAPLAADPESLRDLEAEWVERHGDDEDRQWQEEMPVEQRHEHLGGRGQRDTPWRSLWMRPTGTIPDDPLLHTAFLAWISDDGLMSTIGGYGNTEDRGMRASLDHAMWFHRRPRWDDWLLYRSESPVGHGARALVYGAMYTRAGERVVSVVQEALVRPPRG